MAGTDNLLFAEKATSNASHGHPVRIFIIADPNIYVEGIQKVLAEDNRFDVVSCIKPGDHCIETFGESGADIVLVHREVVHDPMRECFGKLKSVQPDVRIVVFGGDRDSQFVLSTIRAGGQGYLGESMSADDLRRAMREVADGGLSLDREMVEHLVRSSLELEQQIEQLVCSKIDSVSDRMTAREQEVFEYVLEGLSTREIAGRVHLSEQSVKLRLTRLFRKFDVTNRSQLILMAFQEVCPVSNMVRLFRSTVDRRRLERGQEPVIADPLQQDSVG